MTQTTAPIFSANPKGAFATLPDEAKSSEDPKDDQRARRRGEEAHFLDPRRTYRWILLAMLLVMGTSFLADLIVRSDVRRTQRVAVELQTGMVAKALEREIEARLESLRDFARAVESSDHPLHTNFTTLAQTYLVGDVVAVSLRDGAGPLLLRSQLPLYEALLRVSPDAGRADENGVFAVSGTEGNLFLIWVALRHPGTRDAWTTVKAVIEADPLLGEVGFDSDTLDLALRANGAELVVADGTPPGNDAVERSQEVFGQIWTIRASPAGGWSSGKEAVWAVWLEAATAISLGMGLMAWEAYQFRRLRQKTAALTDREEELERLSQRLDLALAASDVGVWEYVVEKDMLIWDKRMHELYATPPSKNPFSVEICRRRIHPEDVERVDRAFEDAIASKSKLNFDFRLLLPDGSITHIRAVGSVHTDRDGLTKVVGINLDITEEVLRSAELEAKRAEAELASVAKSQFLATMSHEIRTPMNGVIGMLDLLLRSDLDPLQRQQAAIAATSARQLLLLLNDVLDFSKLDANRIELHPSAVDIRRLTEDVVTLASATIGERNLRIVVDIAADVPKTIICDPTRVRQVLNNLVGNAVKFTDAGTVEVVIALSPEPGVIGQICELIFSVRDTGIGIPESEKPLLFERYSQVDSSATRSRGGTGLGLAISKQLVELMGGRITVRSVLGLGSTFEFTLPFDSPLPEPQRSTEGDDDAPLSRPARVLVAEDNATNQQVLRAYLELDGHHVTIVSDGEAALESLRTKRYDLVLMDIQMPKLDGIGAARRIREHGGINAGIPIIALTANALPGDRERYIEAGMSEYLSKPVSVDALLSLIDRFTPQRRMNSDPDLESGRDPRDPVLSGEELASKPRSAV